MFIAVLAGMFALSTSIKLTMDIVANKKIEKMGYNINPDNRNIFLQICSFIHDYGYLLIPFYNLINSASLLLDSNILYAKNRLALLKDRNRLTENEKDKPKSYSDIVKEIVDEENQKYIKELEKKKKEVKKEKEVPVKNNEPSMETDDILELKKQAHELALLDKEYRAKYQELKDNNAPVSERNELARKIKQIRVDYDNIMAQIDSLKIEESSQKVLKR